MSVDGEEFNEVEKIRQRKLAELQRSMMEEQSRAQVAKQIEARKQNLMKSILTPEARARLTNIKMVKPEIAETLENQLIQIAQSGRIKIPITDNQLKELLKKIQSSFHRNIRIRRV